MEGDIRNGLALMKYAINHPYMFSAPYYGSNEGNDQEGKSIANGNDNKV